jgi:PAS domain S-box-containing protein
MRNKIRNNISVWCGTIVILTMLVFVPLPAESTAGPDAAHSFLRTIRVVADDNYPPYIFKDAENRLKGILPDQWHLWEKKTGIRVELSAMDWDEAQHRMQNGEFDVIDTIFRNQKREKLYDFSKPYAQIEVPILFHSDISGIDGANDLKGFVVAVKSGDNAIDVLRSHGVTNLLEFNSYEAIVAAARDRKINVFTIDKPPAHYYLYKFGINDRFRETKPLYTGEFHRAVHKGNQALLQTVESGFAKISKAEYEEIEKRWYGTPILSRNVIRYLWMGITVVAVILAGLFLWVWTLRRLVAQRTTGLQKEIHERMRQEELLRESEQKYRLLAENIDDIIWTMNAELTHYTYMSPSISKLGYAPEEFMSKPFETFIVSKYHEHIRKAVLDRLKKEREGKGDDNVGRWELAFLRKNGGTIYVESLTRPLRSEDGVFQGLLGVTRDITERRRAEEVLSLEKTFIDAIFNSVPGMLYLYDAEGKLIRWNKKHEIMTGYSSEELSHMRLMDWYTGDVESQKAITDGIKTTQLKGFGEAEARLQKKDGTTIPMYFTASLLTINDRQYFTGIGVDITERKRVEEEKNNLQAQLIQAQKMEAIGTLAGGIAHDFNNILGAILGYAELAREDCPPGSVAASDLEQVLLAGKRAKDLVRQILAFSRQTETEMIPLQPGIIVKETMKLLRSSLPTTIDIQQDIDSETGFIFADPTQIHQILMNLGTNAYHAMEETGGALSVSVKSKEISEQDLVGSPHIKPGNYMELSVRDNGPGIPVEIQEKIFDPYFTTKATGKGTGMGLAIVHGIVKSYGGFITCDSQVGKGTTFKILLPVFAGHADTESKPAEVIPAGTEHILFIDDETILVEMARNMLERLGYAVTARTGSFEALTTFQNQPDAFDLVITDQTMPGMTGIDLARRMLQIRPGLPIILCTGYSSQVSKEKAKSYGINGFAMKPLTRKDIAALIRKMLDGSA